MRHLLSEIRLNQGRTNIKITVGIAISPAPVPKKPTPGRCNNLRCFYIDQCVLKDVNPAVHIYFFEFRGCQKRAWVNDLTLATAMLMSIERVMVRFLFEMEPP